MLPIIVLALATADPSFLQLREQDARVTTIAWRLQTANAALCPHAVPLAGISLEALSLYPSDLRTAARTQLGLRDRVMVSAVAKGGAADAADLRPGDVIIAVGERQAPVIEESEHGYAPVARVESDLAEALRLGPVTLRVDRQGIARTIRMRGIEGCASTVQIVPGRRLNAQADGRYVQINAAILSFVANDDELAAIIAHELSHNILQHRAARTPSRQAEYAADRLSVWLIARAGFDVEALVPFWTRLARRTSLGIFGDGSHPSTKRRVEALAQAVSVLSAQRARRQELVPPAQ